MRRTALLLTLMMGAMPAVAQPVGAGPTQSRDGLGNGAHPANPANSLPSGAENATTGPQAHPVYPSGSTTPNPGAAFVRTQPKPASGTLSRSPGALATTITGPGGRKTTRPGGSAATSEGAGTVPNR